MSVYVASVYIAAPYSCRDFAIRIMTMLELQSIEVTSRWLKAFDELSHNYAQQDLDDVARADVLVALNLGGWEEKGTGGRHVELGYALALNKKIILVGARSNIFHHLSHIKVLDGHEDLAKQVKKVIAS